MKPPCSVRLVEFGSDPLHLTHHVRDRYRSYYPAAEDYDIVSVISRSDIVSVDVARHLVGRSTEKRADDSAVFYLHPERTGLFVVRDTSNGPLAVTFLRFLMKRQRDMVREWYGDGEPVSSEDARLNVFQPGDELDDDITTVVLSKTASAVTAPGGGTLEDWVLSNIGKLRDPEPGHETRQVKGRPYPSKILDCKKHKLIVMVDKAGKHRVSVMCPEANHKAAADGVVKGKPTTKRNMKHRLKGAKVPVVGVLASNVRVTIKTRKALIAENHSSETAILVIRNALIETAPVEIEDWLYSITFTIGDTAHAGYLVDRARWSPQKDPEWLLSLSRPVKPTPAELEASAMLSRAGWLCLPPFAGADS